MWAGERKIGSIGVHVSRGVTTHGFAVNVENDLQPFEWVVPCGLEGVRMTSVMRETRAPAPGLMPGFRRATPRRWRRRCDRGRSVTLAELEATWRWWRERGERPAPTRRARGPTPAAWTC